jgi:hypothetical protein
MEQITLKHICREFDLDPYLLRQVLRKNLPHRRNQRWKWSPDDPQLKQARALAAQMKEKTHD